MFLYFSKGINTPNVRGSVIASPSHWQIHCDANTNRSQTILYKHHPVHNQIQRDPIKMLPLLLTLGDVHSLRLFSSRCFLISTFGKTSKIIQIKNVVHWNKKTEIFVVDMQTKRKVQIFRQKKTPQYVFVKNHFAKRFCT